MSSPLPAETSADDSSGEVESIISEVGEWIRGADVKAGLLLTGLTVLLASIAPRAHELKQLWMHGSTLSSSWWLAIATGLLGLSFLASVLVFFPRTGVPTPTRYAWPWLARQSEEDLASLSRHSLRSEGWAQARQLARIAAHKYHFFKIAVVLGGASVLCYLVSLVLAS